jgi:hypothetical protein
MSLVDFDLFWFSVCFKFRPQFIDDFLFFLFSLSNSRSLFLTFNRNIIDVCLALQPFSISSFDSLLRSLLSPINFFHGLFFADHNFLHDWLFFQLDDFQVGLWLVLSKFYTFIVP